MALKSVLGTTLHVQARLGMAWHVCRDNLLTWIAKEQSGHCKWEEPLGSFPWIVSLALWKSELSVLISALAYVKLSPRKPMPARLPWKTERTVAALESWQHRR